MRRRRARRRIHGRIARIPKMPPFDELPRSSFFTKDPENSEIGDRASAQPVLTAFFSGDENEGEGPATACWQTSSSSSVNNTPDNHTTDPSHCQPMSAATIFAELQENNPRALSSAAGFLKWDKSRNGDAAGEALTTDSDLQRVMAMWKDLVDKEGRLTVQGLDALLNQSLEEEAAAAKAKQEEKRAKRRREEERRRRRKAEERARRDVASPPSTPPSDYADTSSVQRAKLHHITKTTSRNLINKAVVRITQMKCAAALDTWRRNVWLVMRMRLMVAEWRRRQTAAVFVAWQRHIERKLQQQRAKSARDAAAKARRDKYIAAKMRSLQRSEHDQQEEEAADAAAAAAKAKEEEEAAVANGARVKLTKIYKRYGVTKFDPDTVIKNWVKKHGEGSEAALLAKVEEKYWHRLDTDLCLHKACLHTAVGASGCCCRRAR